jgi:hypothetical protein
LNTNWSETVRLEIVSALLGHLKVHDQAAGAALLRGAGWTIRYVHLEHHESGSELPHHSGFAA